MQIQTGSDGPRVTAVLGPTNTGKTHFAMERMLGHASGIIGFPLRLLARENYDRAVKIKGKDKVALITGEEKIIPDGARYYLCTVESMPQDKSVAFLGVDEIQMAADPDRGYFFTDRLLHARGTAETMFMGADTIRPLLRRLVPEAEIISRPRFSTLTHVGHKKITRLTPRSAIVAFTTARVYELAELIRKQRGGAAVVLGALSPRTRNAQVEMYQAGEVDYLVATDAVGMGLNMDVNHVAFAQTRKFDGRRRRDLQPAELAQIAGRAGRHMNDGTFGTTAMATPLDARIAEHIENHSFKPLKTLFWRNPDLDVSSVEALRQSLTDAPDLKGLVKARVANDENVLAVLADDEEVRGFATTPKAVRLLWEICQVPDFGQVMSDAHSRLLANMYRHLMQGDGALEEDWVARHVARIDKTEGEIDTLVQRIANIRTWTYVSHRSDWLIDSLHWQDKTRDVEDRLSDALHEKLTQRFVDKRSAGLISQLDKGTDLLAGIKPDGSVIVEGHHVGQLEGFRFIPDDEQDGAAAKAVNAAALKALRQEIDHRIQHLENAPHAAIELTEEGTILWLGIAIARVIKGGDILRPDVVVFQSDLLDAIAIQRIQKHLAAWLSRRINSILLSLVRIRADASLTGAARGLCFQLYQSLGSVSRSSALDEISLLAPAERRKLRELGVQIGREAAYMPALLKPKAVELRNIIWAAWTESKPIVPLPPGRVSLPASPGVKSATYEALGYVLLGHRAVRIDILERLAHQAWERSKSGGFGLAPELLSMCGCGREELGNILSELGYLAKGEGNNQIFHRQRKPRKSIKQKRAQSPKPDSPFAVLQNFSKRS
jgi:ATP-dependent RNA helicase SUPV3L1/SUV3